MPSVTSKPSTCSGSPAPVTFKPVVVIYADILEGRVLLTLDEIEEWRHGQLVDGNPGHVVPHAYQLLRMGVTQRLQQHALHHAEHHRVGADADRQRNESNGGKERGSGQSPDHLLELLAKFCHAEPLLRLLSRRLQVPNYGYAGEPL